MTVPEVEIPAREPLKASREGVLCRASSFHNLATAERVVADILQASQSTLRRGAAEGRVRLVLESPVYPRSIGIFVAKGEPIAREAYAARVIVQRVRGSRTDPSVYRVVVAGRGTE